ncbi:MAG: phenylacetate-CoA oxygenase subunit PaaJ [Comamonas sp.]|jgi:ring-1,2-phenylacetyl-CoA epoxidase subunit PaaD|uniref:1,2-phenylacetyl-CoA epoxidase subunit PaaD n=1 Tax=Comamonas sp. TaxID=34028 RepID=UPI002835EE8D|nr:1,2-phenylacetyl-CoA epoxidase subunit PaaD [Comamonas sp.]MDR0213329.1 phenylacetate-CoA oxygenase subunit PaaJ [Comamonas sp.]
MTAVACVTTSARVQQAWAVLAQIPDPEVPVVTLCDLGMVRSVSEVGDVLEVALTPTYSGCPATEMIEKSVLDGLQAEGLGPVQVRLQRAPAWTTGWITPDGREKLRAYGIAPPGAVPEHEPVTLRFVPREQYQLQRAASGAAVACPRCSSERTERLSAYGSTACKALYRCLSCHEPFEYFKPI